MRRVAKWLALAAALGVMLLIFFLSAQDGEVSGALSNTVLNHVQGSSAEQVVPSWFSGNAYANIRKWAHVYVYCALGLTVGAAACLWLERWPLYRCGGLAAAVCVLYAISDEIHQYFVPGRAMLAEDVWIDAVGFVPCILLVCLTAWLWRRLHTKR